MNNRAGSRVLARFPPVVNQVRESGLRADCQDCAAVFPLVLPPCLHWVPERFSGSTAIIRPSATRSRSSCHAPPLGARHSQGAARPVRSPRSVRPDQHSSPGAGRHTRCCAIRCGLAGENRAVRNQPQEAPDASEGRKGKCCTGERCGKRNTNLDLATAPSYIS